MIGGVLRPRRPRLRSGGTVMRCPEDHRTVEIATKMRFKAITKSFTTLADASSATSIKEMAKPENAYTRRRNLLAINHLWDKSRNNKRPTRPPISSSTSTLALAVAMSSSESISSTSDDSTSASSPRLPPLHPQTRTSFNNNTTPLSPSSSSSGWNPSNWRPFSLADVRAYSTVIGSINPDCASFHDETNF
ncbi:small MutS related domain-containing family protein [Hibiscus syriacus]|uniref:Small MutS related domain-containing family protein n=1 Tax=Hibiscus syriacus TaxID=106335 RepID=A0A6A3CXD5_HIBSY|nr:small MutS related domain-containing family protein [Hibiscus syriacus]